MLSVNRSTRGSVPCSNTPLREGVVNAASNWFTGTGKKKFRQLFHAKWLTSRCQRALGRTCVRIKQVISRVGSAQAGTGPSVASCGHSKAIVGLACIPTECVAAQLGGQRCSKPCEVCRDGRQPTGQENATQREASVKGAQLESECSQKTKTVEKLTRAGARVLSA